MICFEVGLIRNWTQGAHVQHCQAKGIISKHVSEFVYTAEECVQILIEKVAKRLQKPCEVLDYVVNLFNAEVLWYTLVVPTSKSF